MEDDASVKLVRAVLGINRTNKNIMNKKLNKLGLPGPPQYIITAAKMHPGCSQDFVTEYFAIGKAAVARGCLKLEKMGLLRREVLKADRRQLQLYLTEKGEEAYLVTHAAYTQWKDSLTEGLSDEEINTAIRLLSRMHEASMKLLEQTQD